MKKLLILAICCLHAIGFAQDSPGVYTVKNVRVNTDYSDFGTAFYGDNKIVFAAPKEGFTFNREEYNSQPFLDLYIGEVTDDGQLIHKQKMPGEINTKFHEGMVSFSKDGKTVYFSANGKIKKVKKGNKGKSDEVKTKATINIQLFKATIDENGNWGNLEMLPFNSDDFSTGHPVLNRDDTKLYFVSDRPGSIGKTDIYVVDIYPDGTYGDPVNLGPEINTTEREMFPFIGKDNVLYFSSDGYPGYGELDVYASKIFDNTVSEPMNLEEPVNSPMDDFAYIIDDTKNKGYFSSNREGGKGDDDIYSFTASPPIYIECQQEISGVVRNLKTQELIPNVKIMLFDEQGQKLQTFLSKEGDASFSFSQACNTTYKIKGYLEGYLIGELDITTVNDLNAKPLEIVFHMEDDPSRTVNPVASADELGNQAAPTILGPVAGGEVSNNSAEKAAGMTPVAQEATSFEEDRVAVRDAESNEPGTGEGGEDVYRSGEPVTATEQAKSETQVAQEMRDKTDVTQESTDGSAPTLLGALAGDLVADKGGERADGVTPLGLEATSFEEDRVAVRDAESNEPGTGGGGEDVYRSGEPVTATEQAKSETQVAQEMRDKTDMIQESTDGSAPNHKGALAAGKETDPGVIDATTFEQDRVRVGGASEGRVQINEKNGFNINTIYFDFDKYAIRADARIELDKLVVWLRENPDLKIEVNAHTDIRGTERYNQVLSDKRADKTVSYLTDRGIDPARINGKGFGESQVVEHCTQAKPCNGLQHQLNRRSEFYLRDPETDAIVFRSRNRTPYLNDDNGKYASNSGMYMNYNFYADDQVYTVQVGAFKGRIQTDEYSELKNLFNHRYNDGLNRYYSGMFDSASAARVHLKEMRAQGFADAFVVKLEGEDREL